MHTPTPVPNVSGPTVRSDWNRSWLIFGKWWLSRFPIAEKTRRCVSSSLNRLCECQNLVGMAVNLDLRPDAGDAPVAADQHRSTVDSHVFFPIHGFLRPYPVGLEHF